MLPTVVDFPIQDTRAQLEDLRAEARGRLHEMDPLEQNLKDLADAIGTYLDHALRTPESTAEFTPVFNAWSSLHNRLVAFLKDDAYKAVAPLREAEARLAAKR